MTESKPPATTTTPRKVHALRGFFMPVACALLWCRVYKCTLKKKIASLRSVHLRTPPATYRPQVRGSGALLPAILLPYSACCKVKGLHAVPYSHKSKSVGSLHLPSMHRLETMRIASWRGCALGRAGHKPAAPQERKGCSFLALCILHTYAASCGYVSTRQCSTHRFARR